jgi:hypothetical protein
MKLLEYLEKRQVVDLAEVEQPELLREATRLAREVSTENPRALVKERWVKLIEKAQKEVKS